MKYRPNLWSTVEKIQCSPDTKRNEMQRTVYIPEVHHRKERELRNAYRL